MTTAEQVGLPLCREVLYMTTGSHIRNAAMKEIQLKDAKAARRTLEELVKSYPNSDAAVAGKERLAQLK